MNPIVIVGTGMAGYTVAREFRKLNADAPLVMITSDDGANYAKPNLSNAMVAKKEPANLAQADAVKMSDTLKATILTHSLVQNIDPQNHVLSLITPNGAEQLSYSKLVLAVGANPIQLPIEGDAANDILFVNSLQDYTEFRTQLAGKEAKSILLIGAGLIGAEFANDLAASGYAVTVVDVAKTPLGRLLPEEIATPFQTALEQIGIQFKLGTSVKKVTQQAGKYLVELADGSTLVTDLILSAVGLRPNLELAEQSQIHTNRGIVANEFLETSAADVYTLGDSAEVNGHLLPYVMPIMQQGRALAKTLNNEHQAVVYPAMPVSVKTPAAPLVVLPPPNDAYYNWQFETTEDGMIAKALDEANQLLGFVLLGATASKQRMVLAKEVPDLMPLTQN